MSPLSTLQARNEQTNKEKASMASQMEQMAEEMKGLESLREKVQADAGNLRVQLSEVDCFQGFDRVGILGLI